MYLEATEDGMTVMVEKRGQVVAVIVIEKEGEHARKVDVHYHSGTPLLDIAQAVHEAASGLDYLLWKETRTLPVPIDFDPLSWDGTNPPHPF